MRAERIIMPCKYKSYPSHRSHRSYSLLALLLATGAVFAAQPAARKPLPETAVLDRVDGRLLHMDANDTWLFELTTEVKTPDWDAQRNESRLGTQYRLASGTRFVLLPSVTLGRLIADVNDRVAPRYRLSARVILFRGQNYLFPTYFLPLSNFKDDKNPEPGEQKPEAGKPNPPSALRPPQWNEPELVIPPEVLERLKKQRPPRGPRRGPEAEKQPGPASADRVLVDGIGRIESGRPPADNRQLSTADSWVFVPYALGWNVGDVRYNLLPCTVLEEALRRQKGALDPIRFNVAGLVTEFQGQKYLLLQRAIVVYNYGNFGR